MDDGSDMDKSEEVLLPGFRFHPTDEELVSFYLRRKIQQKPLSIELIRQLDIYKYDPWDLPMSCLLSCSWIELASSGEKEWYFYCPRDRKYRNSTRPNRVTGSGFWKATGTYRPIYSSAETKCIGLKKSLVFYKGRAAKGLKTDWMMQEFRLPLLTDPSLSKISIDKSIPAYSIQASHFALESSSCTAVVAIPASRFNSQQYFQGQRQQKLSSSHSGSSYKVINFNCNPSSTHISDKDIHGGWIISPFEVQTLQKSPDATSMLLSRDSGIINSMNEASPNTEIEQPEQCNEYAADWVRDTNGGIRKKDKDPYKRKPDDGYIMGNECGVLQKNKFPFDLGLDSSYDWTCNIPCGSLTCPPPPLEMSSSCSTEKDYT